MATIIDSLLVTLGLDSTDIDARAPGVRKKLQELEMSGDGASRGVSSVGKASKSTGEELSIVTGKLTSFLAVLGGTAAVRAFVKDAVDANTQLYFLARNLEVSAQKLFALGAAEQEIGGSKGSIQNFVKSIREMPGQLLSDKMPQLLPLFARLGISPEEGPDKIMHDLADRFSHMDRTVAFGLGVSNGIPEDVMNLLLQGPKAVDSALHGTRRFAPTGKEVQSAKDLKKGFVDIELQLTKIGYDLLYMATPALEKFLTILEQIGSWMQHHEKLVAMVAGVVAALAGLATVIGIVSALGTAFAALTAILTASWPVMAVLALAAAIGLLWQDYEVWAKGGKSAFDWGTWIGTIREAENAWHSLTAAIKESWEWLGKWYDKALKAMGIDTSQKFQDTQEKKAIAAYNAAHPGHPFEPHAGQNWKDVEDLARSEGFFAGGDPNIPQRANNPGDIEWTGPSGFAAKHGATGFITAKGGAKIAVFPDVNTGWNAALALHRGKKYASLHGGAFIHAWQTGSVLNGIGGATGAASIAGAQMASSTTSNDHSRTTHIQNLTIQAPAGFQVPTTPGMARGMNWNTLLTQSNGGGM